MAIECHMFTEQLEETIPETSQRTMFVAVGELPNFP